jgi:hypothetical protein
MTTAMGTGPLGDRSSTYFGTSHVATVRHVMRDWLMTC